MDLLDSVDLVDQVEPLVPCPPLDSPFELLDFLLELP